ncbi:MAG: DUF6079 family protein [Xenococcaceae cyanobacterium]
MANPFASNRVDTPFQKHPDVLEIFQKEFELLKSIVEEIKFDNEHQSKGIVIIGEPGSGKTHLMMRLAQDVLKVNRLFYIRQPNHHQTVTYHTYCRILESFAQKVLETEYTQLQYFLARSFFRLLENNRQNLDNNQKNLIESLLENPLALYDKISKQGDEQKLALWQKIEKFLLQWFKNNNLLVGYAPKIIKGIINFCIYTDDREKQELVGRWLAAEELDEEEIKKINLDNWQGEIDREEFSLQAISVFSRLSLLDEPLIIVFDQLEALGLDHNQEILKSFGAVLREIYTHVPNSLIILNLFPDRWIHFQQVWDNSTVDRVSQNLIEINKPSEEQLRHILNAKAKEQNFDWEKFCDRDEIEDILNRNSIRAVINRANDYYRHKVQGMPLRDR